MEGEREANRLVCDPSVLKGSQPPFDPHHFLSPCFAFQTSERRVRYVSGIHFVIFSFMCMNVKTKADESKW